MVQPSMGADPALETKQTISALPVDLEYLRTLIANVVFIGTPGSADWVLVDTGVAGFASHIADAAKARFRSASPKAIVLTHGHFDHVGSLRSLLRLWDVPVYIHERELPYVTGKENYPPPDPTVGGGLMASLAGIYPNEAIDIGGSANVLPADGSVPFLPEWRWIATPGHTAGHISLFRDSDRALVAGDAFITVKQESAFAVLTQHKEIHGPPMYFTPDWEAACESVRRLEALRPAAAITGHGVPMAGDELQQGLEKLARHFADMAVPEHGRYTDSPPD